LIDCTWGAGRIDNVTGGALFDPSWFTKSNKEFQRTHFPLLEVDQCTRIPIVDKTFWSQDLANCMGYPQGYRIDKGTLESKDYVLRWGQKYYFSYEKSCEHLKPGHMPIFRLCVKNAASTDPLDPDKMVGFKANRDRWEADLTLDPEKYKGCDQVRMYGFFAPLPSAMPTLQEAAAQPASQLSQDARCALVDGIPATEEQVSKRTVKLFTVVPVDHCDAVVVIQASSLQLNPFLEAFAPEV
jgi:hypothetical protein